MMGNTEEVNEKYYTYDTSKLDHKKKKLSKHATPNSRI